MVSRLVRSRGRRVVLLAVGGVLFATVGAGAVNAAPRAAGTAAGAGVRKLMPRPRLHSGCDVRRPAVAYRPGLGRLRRQPVRRPVPCLSVVPGRAGESANVGVLPGGRVVFSTLDEDTYGAPLDDKGPAKVA